MVKIETFIYSIHSHFSMQLRQYTASRQGRRAESIIVLGYRGNGLTAHGRRIFDNLSLRIGSVVAESYTCNPEAKTEHGKADARGKKPAFIDYVTNKMLRLGRDVTAVPVIREVEKGFGYRHMIPTVAATVLSVQEGWEKSYEPGSSEWVEQQQKRESSTVHRLLHRLSQSESIRPVKERMNDIAIHVTKKVLKPGRMSNLLVVVPEGQMDHLADRLREDLGVWGVELSEDPAIKVPYDNFHQAFAASVIGSRSPPPNTGLDLR